MDRWTQIELFVRTVELGSLSKAALELNISSTSASRHLAELERRLDARLLERNTRRQYLTEIGEQFYQRSKESVSIMRDAESAIVANSNALQGTLNISASVTFCVRELGALVAEFSMLYPDVVIRIFAENKYSDLIADNIDVAIRTRQYEVDSNIVVRKLAESKVVLSASPEYIARHGQPEVPSDLARHRLLVYSYAASIAAWTFKRDGQTVEYKTHGAIESNDGLTLRAIALNHAGILFQSYYSCHDDIASGRLVHILPDWRLPNLVCNIAYRNRKFVPTKVRKFVNFLQSNFKRLATEDRWLT